MNTINVRTSKPYTVYVQNGLLQSIDIFCDQIFKSRRVVIATDDIVNSLYGETLRTKLDKMNISHCTFAFKNGEHSKNAETLLEICDFLASQRIGRKDTLIALGGGVVGDVAGFAASIYLRGIDFIQIPTTLLAMVDSSVGGKTGINIKQGKNLVGSFHQPKLVICDTNTLKSLKPETFADGVAEIIKYGMIYDKSLFESIKDGDFSDKIDSIISRCIEIKAEIVSRDEFEGSVRKLLNFGHTIGHSIEKCGNYEKYTHGSAVAVGMVKICEFLMQNGELDKSILTELKSALHNNGLIIDVDEKPQDYIKYCANDKKANGDIIDIIAVSEIGKAYIRPTNIQELLKKYEC